MPQNDVFMYITKNVFLYPPHFSRQMPGLHCIHPHFFVRGSLAQQLRQADDNVFGAGCLPGTASLVDEVGADSAIIAQTPEN